ncbi:hypothetical protein J6590_006477 [Homalodisca vitripennis]|nr:hypothetical protein J6590_006477 [Homalodisca vitripennis]
MIYTPSCETKVGVVDEYYRSTVGECVTAIVMGGRADPSHQRLVVIEPDSMIYTPSCETQGECVTAIVMGGRADPSHQRLVVIEPDSMIYTPSCETQGRCSR